MTKDQIKEAARELCRLEGLDPDVRVFKAIGDNWLNQFNWEFAAIRIERLDRELAAYNHAWYRYLEDQITSPRPDQVSLDSPPAPRPGFGDAPSEPPRRSPTA